MKNSFTHEKQTGNGKRKLETDDLALDKFSDKFCSFRK